MMIGKRKDWIIMTKFNFDRYLEIVNEPESVREARAKAWHDSIDWDNLTEPVLMPSFYLPMDPDEEDIIVG